MTRSSTTAAALLFVIVAAHAQPGLESPVVSAPGPSEIGDRATAPTTPPAAGDLPQQPIREWRILGTRDLTERPSSLWVRIRNGFAMPDLSTPAVRDQEDFYANRPEHIRRVAERSRRYLFHIVEEIERRGMPSELALLPIIESAFNPVALSPAQAAGIWQFIPSTGQSFGLTQNWWIDGRRDIVMATGAALDYLQKLYEMFGTWELALAAYNCGEGCVQRAIQRNALRGERVDFASLQLPAETRAYVPRLQAVKNIIADPSQFGIALPEIRNEPFFGSVRVQQHVDIKVAAKLAGMTVEEFLLLNPAHNRPVINANKHSTLLLPLDRLDQFHANLGSTSRLTSWQIYTPRAGETVDAIAKRLRVPASQLRQVNGLPVRGRATLGDRDLLVPAGLGLADEPSLRLASDAAGGSAAARVRAGGSAGAPARPGTRVSPATARTAEARSRAPARAQHARANDRRPPPSTGARAAAPRHAAARPAPPAPPIHVAQQRGNGARSR